MWDHQPGRNKMKPGSKITCPDLAASFERLAAQIERLPIYSGIYILLNSNGDAIYVGQSANIRARLKSHFTPQHDPKECQMLKAVTCIDYVQESRIIDALAPIYNGHKARRLPIPQQDAYSDDNVEFRWLSEIRWWYFKFDGEPTFLQG